MKDPIPPPRATARDLSLNAWLTIALCVVIAAFGTVLAERFVRARVDLSEDGLYQLSAATEQLVARIEDPVTVRVYASETIDDGGQALRAARIRSQLEEIVGLAPASFLVQTFDPSRSSEARNRAAEAGFRPSVGRRAGLGAGGDEVWLSIELGYRGRVERIPAPRPFEFELQFASALHGLLTDRRVGIGWYGAPIEPTGDDDLQRTLSTFRSTYRHIRSELERRGRFEVLVNLEDGRRIPDEIDVLFVVRPGVVHPRAAYAIDQFVQRGGSLVLCLDDPDYDLYNAASVQTGQDVAASPLWRLAKDWGAEISDDHLFDDVWASSRLQRRPGPGGRGSTFEPLRTPLLVAVPEEGLDANHPATRGLAGVQFAWAHALRPLESANVPGGVTRTDLVHSSESSWLRPIGPNLPRSAETVRTLLFELRKEPSRSFALGAVLEGRFPSPWEGRTAPAPVVGSGLLGDSDETPRSRGANARVVVFGDADWLRDPAPESVGGHPFLYLGGRELALNLFDWLVLDESLIDLRSRTLTPRPLRDFAREEAEALGVFRPDPYQTEAERVERAALVDRARARAQRKQWLVMLVPAGIALLVLLVFGVLWNLLEKPRGAA